MVQLLDDDERKQHLRSEGWPEEVINADDGVTETVPIKRISMRLEGLTAIERLDTDISRLREYATRDGDTARGKEIGLPVLWVPDENGVCFDILWHAWDDWRLWRAPLLDVLALYVGHAYPDYRRLTVRSRFPKSTRDKATERSPVTPGDIIAWEVEWLIENGTMTHEAFVEYCDPKRVLH